MSDFEKMMRAKKVRIAASAVAALVLGFLIFHVGVVVGYHRGPLQGMSHRGDVDRTVRPLLFLPRGFLLPHGFISNAHGAVGIITALSSTTPLTFLLRTREGTDDSILVGTSTIIRNRGPEDSSALTVGDQVIVIGALNGGGDIDAKLIRILKL